jgi:DNA-binding NtrC family response regulator
MTLGPGIDRGHYATGNGGPGGAPDTHGTLGSADRGTLFLDEIADLPLELRPYLARVLEMGEVYPRGAKAARPVRFRFIAASHRDLRAEVKAGRFRIDLFYRISVTTLRVPALRDRPQDVPALVDHFARQVATRYGLPVRRFAPEVLAAFARYTWPGNVRELRNVVSAMMLLADREVIAVDALPAELTLRTSNGRSGPAPIDEGLRGVERDAIAAAIRTHRGNLTRVARSLRISKHALSEDEDARPRADRRGGPAHALAVRS